MSNRPVRFGIFYSDLEWKTSVEGIKFIPGFIGEKLTFNTGNKLL